ncbi:hypothetical protein TSOC_006880 [Tetrabaena socialis]|uniref:Uncharacterized protein n=1 Tax=Tetrabaena socialis TaxID=47790 RepID=A0A2J8A2H3_9CHLO|nr:hypothetical protein TSOC_006880 [Tetrabaena socialis]|eukprot:PNH06713.1 hypothetical protein TSOC_006880 [Tetrabaena socialis]
MPPRGQPARHRAPAEPAAGPHAGQTSIRKAYEALGVEAFYSSHGARYTNPHEQQIFAAIAALMGRTPAAVWLGLGELPRAEPEDEGDDVEGEGEGAAGGAGCGVGDAHGAGGDATRSVAAATAAAGLAEEDAAGASAAALAAALAAAGLSPPVPLRVLDLACGSGEATAGLAAWNSQHPRPARPAGGGPQGGRGGEPGPDDDRGGGGGEPVVLPYDLRITACDPYTGAAYLARTGRPAQPWSFEDLADGCLGEWAGEAGEAALAAAAAAAAGGRRGGGANGRSKGAAARGARVPGSGSGSAGRGVVGGGGGGGSGCAANSASGGEAGGGGSGGALFDMIICSFALHLCEPSRLYGTLHALSYGGRWLAVLAPHKQPEVRPEHGWALVRSSRTERTHTRLYRSLNVPTVAPLAVPDAAEGVAAAAVVATAAAAAAPVREGVGR